MLRRLLVLVADELDQLAVRIQPPVHADRYRLRVERRIVNGDGDFDPAVVHAAEALGALRGASERGAIHIQPAVVSTAGRLDDELVAVPAACLVAVPER